MLEIKIPAFAPAFAQLPFPLCPALPRRETQDE